ncbi:cytochrome c oxidase subunit 4 [Serinibacter salmoneus]|uniref:cytochrome-c oxidase n=1 Tax=Serinibacter salmoneus TaxID=556530 RepID=A0A2A9CYJ5_9MICO|nr:cytochrome c oxidase subunit 4 [Serinibacter salmoneus]PFG19504.1 cytochrome c oxidase subunit IV [Serinibacter salmoneus]
MSNHTPARPDQARERKPLGTETRMFLLLVPFFLVVAVVYGVLTDFNEPVGLFAIPLVGALSGMVGFFLWLTGRRIAMRPEDNPHGTIAEAAGEYGEFSPHSWWPLVLAAGAAITFFGVAVGWWVCVVGFVVGVIGLVGLIFEFSRGQHAH